MALKECSECGKLVSTEARFCVHCGNEPSEKFSCTNCKDYPACGASHGVCPAFRVELVYWEKPYNSKDSK